MTQPLNVSQQLTNPAAVTAADQARYVRDHLPPHGLFAGQTWRITPTPFQLDRETVKELDFLGRVLLQFYRAVNLLYRHSVEGKQPAWIAEYLERGKPQPLIELQRSRNLKNEIPRVIRPDILLTDNGISITELDSVPGGIGLTAWLNQTYSNLNPNLQSDQPLTVIGGATGMLEGFDSIFGEAAPVHIVVSEESATYKPEMDWLTTQLNSSGQRQYYVRDARFTKFVPGDGVYRFFELFDLTNVPSSDTLLRMTEAREIHLTPPPKTFFEEKMLFALLWNRNLRGFWRQELGEGFLGRLQKVIPYTWIMDPAPIPPHAALPEINLTDWHQLKSLSQRDRELILKVSGYSERAWGARGVYFGSDLSVADWSEAVDRALREFDQSPYILQRYHKPRTVQSAYFDFEQNHLVEMPGRVRLCPYYFVAGNADSARTQLGGVLATICPADKKILHGMTDAILAPCS